MEPTAAVKSSILILVVSGAVVVLTTAWSAPAQAQTGCIPVVISGTTASVPGTSFSIAVPAGTPSGNFTACNNGNGTGTVTGALVPGGSCTGPVPTGSNQAAFFTAVSACFSTAAAAPLTQSADAARNASQIGMSVIQTQNQSIRDQIRWKLKLLRRSGDRVLGFAGQPDEDEAAARPDLPWSTSAYVGRGLVTKAPPKAPDTFSVNYSTWAVGFVDHERRDETFAGADIGRRTTTGGGIGGVLAILQGLPFAKPDDILIIGAFGGGTTSHLRTNAGATTSVDGPGAGINAIWMRGGFPRMKHSKATSSRLRLRPWRRPNSV